MSDSNPKATAPSSKVPAVQRLASVLRYLSTTQDPSPLSAIAQACNLNPSTCLYLLREMVAEGLIRQDHGKMYVLGPEVVRLANQWLDQDHFARDVHENLAELSHQYGVTALGVMIEGLKQITVIAKAESDSIFQLSARIGSRFPALISATGRCVAAFGGTEVGGLRQQFERLRWDHPPSWNTWIAQVHDTARLGYAVDDGYYLADTVIAAAPVYRSGDRPSHAIVVIGLATSLRARGIDEVGLAVKSAADRLSQRVR
jgi:DNA-binding IclR family transcriptional regulator